MPIEAEKRNKMEKIVITIETVNAAFEDNQNEVSRILRELADKLESGQNPESLRDINGNKVGTVNITFE
jgi:hypothetical protein